MNNLQWLGLDNNQIVDITPLHQLDKLQRLNLNSNRIEDLTPLIANPGLGSGDEVYLDGNPLSAQARKVASGMYIYRLDVDEWAVHRRMLLLR